MAAIARPQGIPATTKVLGLLCAMYFINYIVRVNVSTAAAVFQPELGLTNTQVGLIFSAFAYPYLAFQVALCSVQPRSGSSDQMAPCPWWSNFQMTPSRRSVT